MTPTERTMPVIEVRGPRIDRSYVVALPGQVYIVAATRRDVERVVSKHAPGSAIRYVAS